MAQFGCWCKGWKRIRIEEWTAQEPYLQARVSALPDQTEESIEVEALMRNAVDLLRRLVSLVSQMPDELLMAAINLDDPRQLVYFVATNVRMELPDAQAILEIDSVRDKLLKLTTVMTKELEVLELGRKIQTEPSRKWRSCSASTFCASSSRLFRKSWRAG